MGNLVFQRDPRANGRGLVRLLIALLLGCLCGLAADDRVRVDNDAVRILTVLDVPGQKGAMHQHLMNRVMIYLDPADITLTFQDGKKEEQHWKPGQVAWSPAGQRHTSENVGSSPARIVEVELKKNAPAMAAMRRPELDPVAIDPAHNILLFENPQVRVFRSWLEPGGTESLHEHSGVGRAVVLLTGLDATVKLQDGSISALRRPAGDVVWSGPVIHSATNAGTGKFELIVVEVK